MWVGKELACLSDLRLRLSDDRGGWSEKEERFLYESCPYMIRVLPIASVLLAVDKDDLENIDDYA